MLVVEAEELLVSVERVQILPEQVEQVQQVQLMEHQLQEQVVVAEVNSLQQVVVQDQQQQVVVLEEYIMFKLDKMLEPILVVVVAVMLLCQALIQVAQVVQV